MLSSLLSYKLSLLLDLTTLRLKIAKSVANKMNYSLLFIPSLGIGAKSVRFTPNASATTLAM